MIDIEPYLHVAQAIAYGYFLPGSEAQDVEQEAMIGLWIAAGAYRPELNPNFEAFASIIIRRRLDSLVKGERRMKRRAQAEAIQASAVQDEGGEEVGLLFIDEMSDPLEILILREELRRILMIMARELSPLELHCLIQQINGRSHADVHGEVGGTVTQNAEGRDRYRRSSNAVDRARRKLAA